MAHCTKFKKEKTEIKRSNRFSEEFTVSIGKLSDFYRAVSTLNAELGHGNWTTIGRPLRKLRRVENYNSRGFNLKERTHDVVFCVPDGSDVVASRLLLELSR